jgi:hypothetical protein
MGRWLPDWIEKGAPVKVIPSRNGSRIVAADDFYFGIPSPNHSLPVRQSKVRMCSGWVERFRTGGPSLNYTRDPRQRTGILEIATQVILAITRLRVFLC